MACTVWLGSIIEMFGAMVTFGIKEMLKWGMIETLICARVVAHSSIVFAPVMLEMVPIAHF